VITCAAGLDGQAGWRRRLAGIGCLFTGLTPSLAVCEQRERDRDDRAAGNAAREDSPAPASTQGRRGSVPSREADPPQWPEGIR